MSTSDLVGLFGEIDEKNRKLLKYQEGSFFYRIGSISESIISISERHILCHVKVGSYNNKFGDLKELLWDKQRSINSDQVNEIINYVDQKSMETKSVNQFVFIATINGLDPKLIDGQHRLKALLSMDDEIGFIIQCVDYEDENERFLDFIKINSNTPLPDFYKSISSHESYCQVLSKEITDNLLINYPFLETKSISGRYGYLSHTKTRDSIFDHLRERSIPMSCDVSMSIVPTFISIVGDKVLFPSRVSSYPVPTINPDLCHANSSKVIRHEQCSYKKKHGDFCGVHKNSDKKKLFNPRFKRNHRFEELKIYDSGFFVLNSRWLDIVMEKIFPPLIGI